MIRTEKQGLFHLFKISFPFLIVTFVYTGAILLVEEWFGDHLYSVSTQLGAVFGLAVAFFLGFRMNSAYDRWWESRKIFGELTNNTRRFVSKMFACRHSPNNIEQLRPGVSDSEIAEMIDLIVIYIRQLKSEMHEVDHPIQEANTKRLFIKYGIDSNQKITNEILLAITVKLNQLFSPSRKLEWLDLTQSLNQFFDIQGKAERINNTPFLKIYGAFTRIIVLFYVLLIPFFVGDIDLGGEASNLEFLAIPILTIISTAFLTINSLANRYGEPLGENTTSVPIDSICENIVYDCLAIKSRLNEGEAIGSETRTEPGQTS